MRDTLFIFIIGVFVFSGLACSGRSPSTAIDIQLDDSFVDAATPVRSDDSTGRVVFGMLLGGNGYVFPPMTKLVVSSKSGAVLDDKLIRTGRQNVRIDRTGGDLLLLVFYKESERKYFLVAEGDSLEGIRGISFTSRGVIELDHMDTQSPPPSPK